MQTPVTIIGAATSIGIRPYDSGAPRRLDLAPGTLRRHGLAERLGADDLGDLAAPPYHDLVRPEGRPRNESEVLEYSQALAERVSATLNRGRFALVLGGDCSVVLGSLLGLRQARSGPVGLVYLDAHADFASPAESRTGSVASMCLALAVGRGDSPLARLAGSDPLVAGRDVVVLGRRDQAEDWYGQAALSDWGVHDIGDAEMRRAGLTQTAAAALQVVGREPLEGFWIHLDADLLNPAVMPAVDSPEPGGPGLDELAELLAPLARHPRALGMELTIYDPLLDPDETGAGRLVELLERLLGSHSATNHPPSRGVASGGKA